MGPGHGWAHGPGDRGAEEDLKRRPRRTGGVAAPDGTQPEPAAPLAGREAADRYFGADQKYRAYPVCDAQHHVLGMLAREDMGEMKETEPHGERKLSELMPGEPVVAFPEEMCESVAIRITVHKLDRTPVIDPATHQLCGMVTRYDLLRPYLHDYDDERLREQVFPGHRQSHDGGAGPPPSAQRRTIGQRSG